MSILSIRSNIFVLIIMRIGLIKEGKTPPDKRVPLSPLQCRQILDDFDGVELRVQSSSIRKYQDEEYEEVGINVVDNLEDCDILLGVKEVPIEMLIPNKHYYFFSHTIKQQPYNSKLLRAILDKNITLTDYEAITNNKGVRLIGFGRYAGVVGCYNAIRAYGLKSERFDLKPAHQCSDRVEMEDELTKIDLPNNFKIVLTGLAE